MKKKIHCQHCQTAVVGRGWDLICLVLQAQRKMKKGKSVMKLQTLKKKNKKREKSMSFYFLFSTVIFQLFPTAELEFQFVTQALWAE